MLDRRKYINSVNANGIFENTYETKIPQTCVFNLILNHFEKAVRKPKCLFIGRDGCRADAMKYLIKSGDDFIFGIFENPDLNGHDAGFGDENYRYVSGICNLDRLSYKLLEAIKGRKSFDEEDWLVVVGSDHGGHSTRHGTQKIQDRTTFLALSKPIEDLMR